MRIVPFLGASPWMAMALPVAMAGCAPPLQVEGGGSGGGQGGGAQSVSSGGGQGGGAQSVSVGAGGQRPASSASSGGSGQGGMGGTVGFNEICDNGADDDLDGDIDCADIDCSAMGYVCAKDFSSPWKGPAVLHLSDFNAPLPPCGEGWANPSDFMAGMLTSAPVQCGRCSCGMPTGGQCGLPPGVGVNVHQNHACTPPAAAFTAVTQSNSCTPVINPTLPGSNYSVDLAGQAMISGGSCNVVAGSPTIPPAYFTQHARICEHATTAGGCVSAFTCAAPPPAQFNPTVCIYQAFADNTPPPVCPMPYGQATILYAGIDDQRSCTACQCAGPTGTCGTTLDLYFDQTCASASFS